MTIKENVLKKLNEQVTAEIYSSHLYLSMAAYFESENLKGMAKWMISQSHEEMQHAMRLYNFINERGGTIELDKIDKPKINWKNALEVFEDSYEHETKVTAMIHDLVKISRQENDYAAESMLMWFVDEQVEEEDSANEIVEKLRKIKDDSSALYMLDKELGTRPDKGVMPPVEGE